ncbi:MAG: hypothetical protein HY763_17660 [Planctomycetes bacterium]|nr:hypothetical protein [Planctomycetota bacterium]
MGEGRDAARINAPPLARGIAPARGLSPAWLMAAVALVLYGSLLPFQMRRPPAGPWPLPGLSDIGFHASSPSDLLTNVGVYIPVGFVAVLAGHPRRRRLARVPLAIALALGVSVAAEALQAGMSQRVSSWVDVRANCMGTALGAVLALAASHAGPRLAAAAWVAGRARPFATSTMALTLGLLLFGLAPFDLVTSASGLSAAFLRARWDLNTARFADFNDPPLSALVAQVQGAAWFALLAYLSTQAGRERGRSSTAAGMAATRDAIVLALLIEFMQLFTASHVFDLAAIVLRAIAAGLGAWYAVRWGEYLTPAGGAPSAHPRTLTALLILAAVGQTVACVAAAADLRCWNADHLRGVVVHWIPLESLWRLSLAGAAGKLLEWLATYGALAATAALVAVRCQARSPQRVALLVATLVALATAGLGALNMTGRLDISQAVVAVVVVLLGARAWRAVSSSAAASGH